MRWRYIRRLFFMDRSWILLGMMGAGKSAVGRSLSVLSQREFMDTDQILQVRLGRPIPQLFRIYGETMFRDHETSLLQSLEPKPIVLATGGGIVIRPENFAEIRRLGISIYLRASAETLIDRLEVSKKKRPLLDTENWEGRLREILAARLPLYEQADVVVDVDGLSVEDAAQTVLDAIGARTK